MLIPLYLTIEEVELARIPWLPETLFDSDGSIFLFGKKVSRKNLTGQFSLNRQFSFLIIEKD